MSNQAITFYKEYLINFDHILLGSYALKLYNSSFRDPNDVDLYFPNTAFVYNWLSKLPENKDQYTLDQYCEEYTGDLLEFQIKFKDSSHIDVMSAIPPFGLIKAVKVAELQQILKVKTQILWSEIECESPNIFKIKKHLADLKFFNAL